MKVTQAVLFLALIGSVAAHADLPAGQTNCQAALNSNFTAPAPQKRAEDVVKTVYADNTPAQPVAPSSSRTAR